jgi:hypothetical protein
MVPAEVKEEEILALMLLAQQEVSRLPFLTNHAQLSHFKT